MELIRTQVHRIENNLDDLVKVSRRRWMIQNDKYLKENDTVLDLGSGPGVIPFYFYKKGLQFNYVGVDKKKKQLKISNRLFKKNKIRNAKCMYCDFDEVLPFCDNSFNHVWLIGCYVRGFKSTYKNVFDESYRVLKPGGLLIFDAPSDDENRDKYKHRTLSEEMINNLIDKHFTIVSKEIYARSGTEERPVGHPQRTNYIYHYWGFVFKKIEEEKE